MDSLILIKSFVELTPKLIYSNLNPPYNKVYNPMVIIAIDGSA